MRTHQLFKNLLPVLILCIMAAFPCFASGQEAEAEADASQSSVATTNTPQVEVPKSAFAIPTSPSEGRDPFFPLSRRLVMDASPKNTETTKVAVTLALKGVSRSGDTSFALINDKTFAAGEEREITVGNGKVRVHCIEIREDSAVVEINGTRQVLRLRPGL